MSRGYDHDERDGQEPDTPAGRMPRSQGRSGGGAAAPEKPYRSGPEPGSGVDARDARSRERSDIRYGRQTFHWSDLDRAVMMEVGRFRTMDEEDIRRVYYGGTEAPFRDDQKALLEQGLIERRSVVVGKNRDIRHVVVLSKQGKKLLERQGDVDRGQAIYAGFVKPAEASHDASVYRMFEAEKKEIESRGGSVRRVVLDFEFKKKIYSELNREGDYGEASYARRQQELAELYELPTVNEKIALPDLRIEYETRDGDRAHIDLELATEHYRPGHMQQKTRAGFKMYGVNTTSRGHRAGWEGRELTAEVLAF